MRRRALNSIPAEPPDVVYCPVCGGMDYVLMEPRNVGGRCKRTGRFFIINYSTWFAAVPLGDTTKYVDLTLPSAGLE